MESKISSYNVFVDAVLPDGSRRQLIMRQDSMKRTFVVSHEGFISVQLSSMSVEEVSLMGRDKPKDKIGLQKFYGSHVNLNILWEVKPIEYDYFYRHQDN